MSRYYSWLNTAATIIKSYKGEQPLAGYLKTFFASQKKYGSTDRKQISHLCYCYYRLGKLTVTSTLPVEEMIAAALLLCSTSGNSLLDVWKPSWTDWMDKPVEARLQFLNSEFRGAALFSAVGIFPWHEQLSEEIDYERFCLSFFTQPDVYLRIRPGHAHAVIKKIKDAGVSCRTTDQPACIAFESASRLEEIIALNKEAVVQDYNSQQVLSLIKQTSADKINVWDCCAASGGKSILAADTFRKIDLTVSDIRQSIIANLRRRLAIAGVSLQQALVIDVTKRESLSALARTPFDLVICDAPCSGSGTWSRTPEQLRFFEQSKINEYHSLQQKIASNAISQIRPGGYMLYITCSVFKMENEMMVDFLQKKGMHLIETKLLTGYDKKADTMFAALLKKP
ncbi:MAG: Fmu (Sun) domain-containing protein [Agriterribacter sp.]